MMDKELVCNQGFLTFQRVQYSISLLQAMLGDLTTTDVYFGRAKEVMDRREAIKRRTLETRQRHHVQQERVYTPG